MDRHRRDPYPKAFKVVAARASDDRFYGVVVKGFGAAAPPRPRPSSSFGQNLNPAEIKMSSSSLSNLIRLTQGHQEPRPVAQPQAHRLQARRPEDPRQRPALSHRPEGPLKLDLESMLDDLRVRGDRQQLYWHRISIQ